LAAVPATPSADIGSSKPEGQPAPPKSEVLIAPPVGGVQPTSKKTTASTSASCRCPICLEDLSSKGSEEEGEGDEGEVGLPCKHRLCRDCFVNYIESLVNSGRVGDEDLCCPLPECRSAVTTAFLTAFLAGKEEHRRLRERLLDFQAQRFQPEAGDGEQFLTCPTANCAKLLVPNELVENQEAVTCPTCSCNFCAGCCQQAHPGLTCEDAEFRRMDPALRKLMEKETWVRCPSCRHLCERESGCNFMTCPSEVCQSKTHFCYLCGVVLAASDHAAHYEGFEGAVGRMGPFGSVCVNKRSSDLSLPERPPPPMLSVAVGEEEGSIVLRLTFGEHRSEPPTIYYKVALKVPGLDEEKTLHAGVHDAHFDMKPGRLVQKYCRYQVAVTPFNINGSGPQSDFSEVVHFHPRELNQGPKQSAVHPAPAKPKRWAAK